MLLLSQHNYKFVVVNILHIDEDISILALQLINQNCKESLNR